jgi:Flp pilus assembly protein TadG
MKKLITFLKSKRGSHAIEAIIIVPIWLAVILFCIYTQSISKARQTLADESSAIANIVAISENEAKAKNNVLDYIKTNNLTNKFDTSKGTLSFLTIEYDSSNTNKKWQSGEKLYLYVTIDTAFIRMNFNQIKIGDEELNLFKTSFTNRIEIIIL